MANDWVNAVATLLVGGWWLVVGGWWLVVGGLRLVAEDNKCKRPSFEILRKVGAFVSATPKFARLVWSTPSRHSALPAKTYIGSLALNVPCPGFAIMSTTVSFDRFLSV
jgi:hypothetical protein